MELVKIETPELDVIEKSKAEQIKSTFEPMVKMLSEFEQSFEEVVTESENEITKDVTTKAKRLRIDIGKVRIETEKLRKEQKEEFLRAGKAIDGVSNILKWAVTEKENKLKEIENYFEIQEQKRLDDLQLERVELLTPFVEDAHERQLSSMDMDVWNAYFEAKKKEYNDRIEAEKQAELDRVEKQRIEKLSNERYLVLIPYADFFEANEKEIILSDKLGLMNDSDYVSLSSKLKIKKVEFDKEQERIKKENEQLKKEAKEKDRLAKIERERIEKEAKELAYVQERINVRNGKRNKELKPYIVFIRDYSNLLNSEEKEYQKQFNDIKKGAELQWEHDREEEKRKYEQEQKDKEEQQKVKDKLLKKEQAEKDAKEDEEKRLQAELNKGDAAKVKDLISDLEALKTKYSFKSAKNTKIYAGVNELIDKVVFYIKK